MERQLVARSRRGRTAEFTLLREDGSGSDYDRPTGKEGDVFINVPHDLWTNGPDSSVRWFEVLSLPELAFMIIALSNRSTFRLPVERGPSYYGISADSLLRGSRGLREKGVLLVQRSSVKAPLAPEGFSYENEYTVLPPFAERAAGSKTGGTR